MRDRTRIFLIRKHSPNIDNDKKMKTHGNLNLV
jgi:hypothetical protein